MKFDKDGLVPEVQRKCVDCGRGILSRWDRCVRCRENPRPKPWWRRLLAWFRRK